MATLPPNPFSELLEKDMEEFNKTVQRRHLGLSGMTHHVKTYTPWFRSSSLFIHVYSNYYTLKLQTAQKPNHTVRRHMD